MKTDYDKLKELLTLFGIGFSEDTLVNSASKVITLEEGMAKVEGYIHFYCDYVFTEAGEFVEVRILE